MYTWGEILRHNGKQFLIAIDQAFSCVVCTLYKEKAYGDESLSSRSWRWYRDKVRKYPKMVIDMLFCWEKNHCEESYKSEIDRLQLPPEMRK
jgi:hypothetical protein